MDMFEKVKSFVRESFNTGVNEKSMEHFEKTVDWLKRLKPDADEPMLIAAYAHDIARAFRTENTEQTFKDKEFNDPEILKEHQEQGAQIVNDFLRKNGYDEKSIDRVANMIRHHEEGGDQESDLIKDSDSLSYLEVNAKKHIALATSLGKGRVKRKVDWMFDRISSDETKKLANPLYQEAKNLL